TAFVNKLDGRRYNPGPQVGIVMGYDILPILSLGVGVAFWGGELSPPDEPAPPEGDLFFVTPLLRAQVAVFTTERNYVWIRGDVGLGFGFPASIDGVDYGGTGPVIGVTAGFERFTKLRHFAIGVHGGVVVVTEPAVGVGVTITPTLKYTF
ncbi:MAG: adventurous gliding motility protein CglE, partial [Myxococcota bacterium]